MIPVAQVMTRNALARLGRSMAKGGGPASAMAAEGHVWSKVLQAIPGRDGFGDTLKHHASQSERMATPTGHVHATRRRFGAAFTRQTWHIWTGAALAVIAALAASSASGAGRFWLTVPFLLFVPGHLLVQAFVSPRLHARPRPSHLAFAVGASPAVLGLCALATALLDHGFTGANIVAATTLTCLGLAGVALARWAWGRSEPHAATPMRP